MISPDPAFPSSPDLGLVAATEEIFRPGGQLEQSGADLPFPIEHRPQQYRMALESARTLEQGGRLVAEAGTGVGKSFAYLVPAALAALRRRSKVVISTYTIALQEQLITKDIPFLQRHLELTFRAVLVKGRSNYLCLRRLDRARRMGDELFQAQDGVELEWIRDWAAGTKDGSWQDLPRQPSSDAWNLVCAEQGNCLWQKCPEYATCFFIRARQQMAEADQLVVNHHLFFSDLSLKKEGKGILPPYEAAILDEAHMVESVASDHFGLRLTHRMVDYWLRRLYAPDSQKGILAVLRDGASAHLASGLQRTADHFFADVRERLDVSTDGQQRVVDAPLPVDSSLVAELGALVRRLGARAESVQDEGVRAELQSLIRRGGAMRDALHSFLVQGLPDHVYWVEAAGRRQRNTALQSAPIDVADGLREHLFEAVPSVLLTSATLAIDHRLDYVQHRLGVESAQSVQLGSPFQFERQMRILIPESMPDPNDGETYCRAAAEAIVHFARRTRGRAFVLFTSARMMKEVAGAARGELESGGYQLLVQDAGLPRHQMLEQFRLDGRCVLFGLDSFWTGVDVRGEALSNVMIARLPFAVPDQPIVQARMRRIRERGGDPFKEYTLPEAILKFRQGVGRLIRTATDQGIVVVLDPRIRTKWYGRLFIRSLPECPVEVVPMV